MADKGKVAVVIGGLTAITIGVILATRPKAVPPAPPTGYICPYCDAPFDTYEELVTHVQIVHPGERIPIEIIWE